MLSSQVSDRRPARIRFLKTEEGGRLSSPVSGVRSQIELGEMQTSCVIDSSADLEVLPLGEDVEVLIRILFAEYAREAFFRASSVRLFEGNKLVATGNFLDES